MKSDDHPVKVTCERSTRKIFINEGILLEEYNPKGVNDK